MQTLVEKLYEQKIGGGLYQKVWPDEIRMPARFPGAAEIEMPAEQPLEIRLGCQVPQRLYVMYSFGVNDKPVTVGGWFEPLAGATLGPYPGSVVEQDYKYSTSHGGSGMMSIHRKSGDCLHTFGDGGAHIDVGGDHSYKLGIERMGSEPRIKGMGGYF